MRSQPRCIRRRSTALPVWLSRRRWSRAGACASHNGRNNYRRSPVVRSSRRVGRLPPPPAVRRINQPKNYKHARRFRRILPGAVRPRWRYFSQCASHDLTADAGVSSYSQRSAMSTTPASWRCWRWRRLEEEAICWMFVGSGRRRRPTNRLLRRRVCRAASSAFSGWLKIRYHRYGNYRKDESSGGCEERQEDRMPTDAD